MKDCTCLGTCKGKDGLGPGWRCALDSASSDHQAPPAVEKARDIIIGICKQMLSESGGPLWQGLYRYVDRMVAALSPVSGQAQAWQPIATAPKDGTTCEHGRAWDVHCCNCHGGFLFDSSTCTCLITEWSGPMDTRDGTMYDTLDDAKRAGVPDEDLVSGTREALEKLRTRLVFTKGSFKSAPSPSGSGVSTEEK